MNPTVPKQKVLKKNFTFVSKRRYLNIFKEMVTERVWKHNESGFLLVEFQTATYHEWRYREYNGRTHGHASLVYWVEQFRNRIERS